MKYAKNVFSTMWFSLLSAIAVADDHHEKQHITEADKLTVQEAPANNFSGKAVFARYPVMPSSGNVAPAIVTFEKNAVTNWHVHTEGQYLIVTEGEGRIQEWGKPVKTIKKGDVIWCPPNVKHWHGASPYSSMTHIAISPVAKDGKSVTWLEKVDLPVEKEVAVPLAENSVVLTQKQLNLIPIAAFTATGNLEKLRPALIAGLDSGLTVNEIKEALVHQYAYAGFPRSLNGLLTLREVLEKRKLIDVQYPEGEMPSNLSKNTDYYQLGTETLSYLSKAPADQPLLNNFSPAIDYALKAHLFGYLFSRDNLSYVNRELVTISTLSALGNVNNQLRSHLKIAGNLGLDQHQMQKVIETLKTNVGTDVGINTQNVLKQLQ